ncbi:protein FLX-like 2 [Hordeum vulgare]|uniref:Protein FLX-like 2 n=1 Tax=Hordeum vulgare subsp. vulgare TaxID=112509 RepID=A0A287TWK6_HORVV|nr:protein FLX-like 2 [Hordeum vulgare]KAI4983520.1 hypothetical protein ZWY2020_025386 [Hordeum vulgare]
MGSKGRMPPSYHHRPLPGSGSGPPHGMMHRDPYGPGMHPPPGPGPYPYDMLPPPEILEQKLAVQCGEIQKLAVENERLATSHVSLRKELAAAQQELQRLQAQGEAAKAAEEQEMRGLLDKAAKMEADLKSYESVKADLQQAHTEAQNLAAARQHLSAEVQKLNKDLQRNFGEAQQLPALMADLDAARQEYQHLRAAYEYERKLKMDHSESLQVTKTNYDSMVTELEKLRAELTNSTNIDRSGTLYNPNLAQKDGGTSGRHSAYDGGYGGAQARTPPGMPDPLSGSPAGTAPLSGYDPSRGNAYETSRLARVHDASRGATGYDSLKVAGYDTSRMPALGAQTAAPTAHGSSAGYYGSAQVPPSYASGPVSSSSYGATTARPHGSAQGLSSYGQTQAPSSYAHTQIPPSYGLAQASSHFGPTQGGSPYGLSARPQAYGSAQAAPNTGGAYQTPHGRR